MYRHDDELTLMDWFCGAVLLLGVAA